LLPGGKGNRVRQKRKKEKKADPFQNRKGRAPLRLEFNLQVEMIAFAEIGNPNKNHAASDDHTWGEESISAWSGFENDGAQCQHCQEQNQRCKKDAPSPHKEILLIAPFPVASAALP
jgi:hypothetical protein